MKVIQIIQKRIVQYKVLAIFLMFITFVGIDFVSFKINQHSSVFVKLVKKYHLVPILSESENFYKTYDTPLQTDEFAMLLWLWPERAYSAEKAFDADPFYRIYSDDWKIDDLDLVRRADSRDEVVGLAKIFGKDTMLYEVDERIGKIMTDPTDDVVLKALYCGESSYDNFDYELLSIIRDDEGGYGDTHYLLSLLFLEKLKCGSANMIEQDKQAVIQNIFMAEVKDEEFSDLFVERIVLLYWAGQNDKIKLEWINRVAQNIQKDGGWKKNVNTDRSDPHATGLAALSIKYFLGNTRVDNILIK